MADMLVNLYDLPEIIELEDKSITIKRALAPDAIAIKEFAKVNFNDHWVGEVEAALSRVNPTCFIAVKDKKVIGFACFEATAPSMFGPTGVHAEYRGLGIGKVLLLKCLYALKEIGYPYAIIGSVGAARGFYEKSCNALWLDMFDKSIYSRMI